MSNAFLGVGTELAYEDPGNPGTYVPVAEVLSVSGPSLDRAEVDVTNMDSTGAFREFIPGLGDPGEVTFGVNYDPTNASHDETDGLVGMLLSRDERNWRLKFPTAVGWEWLFDAWVKAAPLDVPVDSQVQLNVTLRVTGQPTIQASV